MADPFTPRTRVRLPDLDIWGVPVKVHWIDADGAAWPPDALWAGAVQTIHQVMPEAMAAEGGSEGAGFVILHRGTQGIWLLMDWWAHGDILCQRLARADIGGDVFDPVGDRPLMACVWELEVIEQERRAWIAHMMQPAPNGAQWLKA